MAENRLRLTPRAFIDLKVPHSPHLSPDGKRVVIEVSEPDYEESRYVTRLWLADTVEGNARQITFSYEGEHHPRWSPDGRHIAFLSSRPDLTEPPPPDESEEDAQKEQVWLLPADGGEAYRLTTAKEGVRNYEWMPNGTSILYLCDEARPQPIQFPRDDARKRKIDPTVEHDDKLRRQLWEVAVEDKKAELVFTGDFGLSEFEISPDGKRLVFNTNYTGEPNDYPRFDLYVLEMENDSEPRLLTDRKGGKFRPQWSQDGSRIAFLSVLDPDLSYSQECVWEVPAEGGEPHNLFADVSYDAHDLLWSRADAGLYALVADRTNGPLVRITSDGVRHVTASDLPSDCSGVDAMADTLVAILEDNQSPPELYVIDPNGSRRALTELSKQFVEQYALPRQEVIRWQTDGGEIEGVLTYPRDHAPDQPAPLVVQVHGGPKGRSSNTLRSYNMHAVWASEGYMVFRPNFRGSEGYGNAFAIANRRDLGGGDFRDIMAGVDHLLEQGLVDPAHMGIMGGSYGGYMTNWAIGHTDRFAAAISQFGIFNLVTDYSNSELSRWDPEYMGALYWEDPEIYRRCSPSSYLEDIKTPVLIMHGDSDSNTFISNSKEMYQALRARGVAVQFAHYPREGHGVREPNHKLDEMRRCLAWFDKHLKGAGKMPPTYRIGDRIEHEGYEFHVLRAEDGDYNGWREEDGRLVEVAISIASQDPVEEAWQFSLADLRLVGPDGDCPLRGIPTDAGGGRTLVLGDNLAVIVHPDKDTGRLSVALSAAFQIPHAGGDLEIRVADLPPVAFLIGPKEEKDEHDERLPAEDRGAEGHTTPSPPLGEEPPIQTPQRPPRPS
jgi:dipeptidyl aminopeptidase/acylaminoacyl peptidase